MASRDDMVIRPRIKGLDGRQTSALERAREERRMAGVKKSGLLGKVARVKGARRVTRRRRLKTSATILSRARGAGVVSTGIRIGGSVAKRAAVFNPIGMAVAVLVVASAVALRLVSGRSFENMGQLVNNMLLGDMDETAKASMETRQMMGSDTDIARIIGQEGGVNSQIAQVHKTLAMLRKRDLVGRSLIMTEAGMQANGVFDMLILRARRIFLIAFKGSGGDEAVKRLEENYKTSHAAGGSEH